MRNKILAACLILLLAVPLFGKEAPSRGTAPDATAVVDFNSWIDANQILMFVTNKGSFAYDNNGFLGKNDGLYFPFTSMEDLVAGRNVTSAIFAGSIWCGAIDAATGDTLVTSGQHWTDWSPGPLDGSGEPPSDAETNQDYRVYKLYSDSLADNPNEDYLEWPIDQGAPFQVTLTGDTIPDMMGDQMMWSVYNDMDPSAHSHAQGTVGEGLGLEVRQTAFAFDRVGALANMVFLRFRMYNKGPYDLQDMHVSIWADPDLGDAGDDFVGCDTLTSLGFCYNDGSDQNYGSAPPAVGYDFFQGPMIASAGDTALMWGFQEFPDMKNLGMSSFNKYINGTDPESYVDTWEYMNGLDASKDPTEPVTDPVTGDTTKYYGNGDPVTGEGFIDVNSSDRRWMQTTGPFDFAQGDSTEIVVAVILGQGGGPLGSITALRTVDDYAQKVYDAGFVLPAPPDKPDVTVTNLNNEVVLEWGTASEDNPGDYPFEGYAVMQGEGPGGPWTDTLAWYDVKNGIDVIIDTVFNTTAGQFFKYVAKPGLDDGLEHIYSTTRDASSGAPLVNYRPYYFRVEAYSYDPLQPAGDKTLTSATVVTAMPQSPLTGTTINTETGVELTVTHTAGNSPGTAEAYIVNPAEVTGHDYNIVFTDSYDVWEYDTTSYDPLVIDTTLETIEKKVWHVVDVNTGDTVVNNWTNQSDVEGNNYPIADGILFKAFGPAPSVELFSVVANGAGDIDPPESGAAPWYDFPVPTDVDPDGYPTAGQQVGDGLWLFHTADNGGTCGGGERYDFAAFNSRATRDGANFSVIGGYDYEMRFTGDNATPGTNGSYAIEAFLDDNVFWVPFELWRIGIGTPDDPSDDVRLVPLIIDDGADDMYQLESYGCVDSVGHTGGDGEHSVSGGDNDPFTDWVYWYTPTDLTPGEVGYLANEAQMTGGTYDYTLIADEVFARTVLVNWNGGIEPPFNQDCPEQGTVFRITTAKPNGPSDVFSVSTAGMEPGVRSTGTDQDLANIKAVPNPYYLFSENDESTFNRTLKFINLPSNCTITIYNLAGDLVRTLVKEDASATEMRWDLLNEFSIPVGSGIYIYVVDSPDFGEKVGKMAVFTEVELLNQY